VWLFRGDLGAGKTTAIRGLLRAAGVRQTVTSPTFSLLRTYRLPGRRTAYHFDAYRVKSRSEWAGIGLLEALADPRALVLVEWPERLRGLRWGPRVETKITITPRGRKVAWRKFD
jgi:tRNA threonylcarbamoyladenosine biosynthesis protein TsaE